MVRNPWMSISKDLMSSKRFDRECDWRGHMRAIADCGMSLTGGMPVLQSFYMMLRRVAGDVKPGLLEINGFYHLAQGMDRGSRTVCNDARASFYNAFGMSPDTQQALEYAFDHCEFTGTWSGQGILDNNQFLVNLSSLLNDE